MWISNQTLDFGLSKLKPKYSTDCFPQATKVPEIPFQT